MLEYANYVGNYYGTPKQAVEEQCAAGHDVLLKLRYRALYRCARKCPDAVFVFIAPPSMKELERRLVDRRTESEEVICSRLKAAETECSLLPSMITLWSTIL